MKLKAYTFMEIIVVMILSSIVIGATITVFLNINKFLNSSNKNLLKTNELILFDRQINADIHNADAFSIQGNEIGVFSGHSKIFYELLDSTIVRYYDYNTDTFAIKVNDFKATFFEKQKRDCRNLVLFIDFYGLEYPLVLEKDLDKSMMVNLEINK